jgi:hypothetical protein
MTIIRILRDYVEPFFCAVGVIFVYAKTYDAVHSRYLEYKGRRLWKKIEEEDKG